MPLASAVFGPPHSCSRAILVAGRADQVVRIARGRGVFQGLVPGATVSAVEVRATAWEAAEIAGQLERDGFRLDRDVWVTGPAGGPEAGAACEV
jgi:hypothetical protein